MPIFMSGAWLATQSPEYGWLEATLAPDRQLVLPYVVRRRAGIRWLQFQWSVWCTSPEDLETERALLEGVVQWCRSQRIGFIAQPATMALFRTAPAGARRAAFGTVLTDLSPDEATLWTMLDGANRNALRKAKAQGITVEWGSHLAEEAHALCNGTMARSGLGFPTMSQFRAIVDGLGEWLDLGVARLDGEPKACVVNPWSRYGSHCLFAGTAAPAASGAANLVQWEAMLRAKRRGAGLYDLVGVRLDPAPDSKHAGIRRFKMRFGGELVEGCLWKMPISRWRYDLYEVISHLSGRTADIIDQESEAV